MSGLPIMLDAQIGFYIFSGHQAAVEALVADLMRLFAIAMRLPVGRDSSQRFAARPRPSQKP